MTNQKKMNKDRIKYVGLSLLLSLIAVILEFLNFSSIYIGFWFLTAGLSFLFFNLKHEVSLRQEEAVTMRDAIVVVGSMTIGYALLLNGTITPVPELRYGQTLEHAFAAFLNMLYGLVLCVMTLIGSHYLIK